MLARRGEGPRVVAGLSGGADSTALIAVLVRLGCDVFAVHVDHGMRPGSTGEEGLAGRTAAALGTKFASVKVKVDPPTEAEARARRYEALQAFALKVHAPIVAVGHTADDQAETVAMRLERGGFGMPMPYVRPLGEMTLVRPLLDLTRHDTESVCRELGIEFFEDPTNRDQRFSRNRIRAELAARPGSKPRLVQVGSEAAQLSERIRSAVRRQWESSVRSDGDLIVIDVPSVPEDLLGPLVRSALSALDVEPTVRAAKAAMDRIQAMSSARFDLPGEAAAWKEGTDLVLGRWPERPELPELALEVGATVVSPEWGLGFKLEEQGLPQDFGRDASGFIQLFDASKLTSSLLVRQWRPGDRMHPLGASGSKKIQDLFTDLKVPRRVRHEVPLLVSLGQIAWVVGYRIAEKFKLDEGTISAVRVEVLRVTSQGD